ncbi:MAG: hypothetical protein ACE5HE_14800, partial [Phycisphaerae bacterium]
MLPFMPARIVIGANGPTLAAPALGGFIQDGSFTGHKRAGALRRSRRCLIPRMLVGLPVSTWMLLDALILSGALWFAYKLYPPPELLATPHIGLLPAIVVFTTMLTIAALIFGLHERETIMSRSRIATRLMLTAVVATAMTYAVVYVLMYATVSRRATGATMTAFVLISGGIRLGAWWAIHRVHLGVLVVGRECLYRSFQQARERDEFKEYRLVGFASHDSGGTVASDEEGYLGPIVDLVPKLDELMVTDVVVGAEAAGDARAMEWMVPCLQRG